MSARFVVVFAYVYRFAYYQAAYFCYAKIHNGTVPFPAAIAV